MEVLKRIAKPGLFVAAAVLLFVGRTAPAYAQEEEKSLYDRLGGVYAIATVVDEFINQLVVNELLNANPAIAQARDRVSGPGLKYRVTELVCQATGGPCTYTGRSMRDAHAHMNITEREWQEMVSVFKRVLDGFEVPEGEQQELFNIIEGTKGEIVMRTP